MTEELKNCPICGGSILAIAKKCKHCKNWIDGSTPQKEGTIISAEGANIILQWKDSQHFNNDEVIAVYRCRRSITIEGNSITFDHLAICRRSLVFLARDQVPSILLIANCRGFSHGSRWAMFQYQSKGYLTFSYGNTYEAVEDIPRGDYESVAKTIRALATAPDSVKTSCIHLGSGVGPNITIALPTGTPMTATESSIISPRSQFQEMPCPNNCGKLTSIRYDSHEITCSSCRRTATFVQCQHCGFTIPVSGSGSWVCSLCQQNNPKQILSSAYSRTQDLTWIKSITGDSEAKVLADCTLVGGHGHSLPAGTECGLLIGGEWFVVRPKSISGLISIPWKEITHIDFSGKGALQQGGGFMGGGFGLVGFAVGLAAATALNAITSRTSMDSYLQIRTNNNEYIFHSALFAPETLRVICSALVGTVERARLSRPAIAPLAESVADQLAKIKVLHDNGVLSVSEYEMARARLVRELTSG